MFTGKQVLKYFMNLLKPPKNYYVPIYVVACFGLHFITIPNTQRVTGNIAGAIKTRLVLWLQKNLM